MYIYRLLLAVSLLPISTILSAQTNWHVATTGSDATGDGSISNPFATVDKAAKQTGPGDTVFVHAGTYRNSAFGDGDIWGGDNLARITADGTPDNFIVFTHYQSDNVLFEFDDTYGFLIQSASYLKFIGFEFKGIADQITQSEADSSWGLYKDSLGIVQDLAVDMGIDINDSSIIGTSIDKVVSPGISKPSYYNGRAIVANNSHHIDILNNIIRDVPSAAIRSQKSDYVNIIGNEVYNNTYWTSQGVGAITIAEATVQTAGDTVTGIKIRIENNLVYNNENRLISWNPNKTFVHFVIDEGTGIFLTRNADTYDNGRMLIANNISHNNGASGIVCHFTNRVIIEHNTVYNNGTTNHGPPGGIGINTVDDVIIRNNISYARPDSWALGILAQPVTNTVVDSNLIYNENGAETIHRNMPDGWKEADPLFTNQDSENFTLTSESPAIDAGITTATQSDDIEGTLRDSLPDIGAYEYVAPQNNVPVITAIADTSMFEDGVLSIPLHGYDLDGDTLNYVAIADTTALSAEIMDTTLTLTPGENWYGSAIIEVTVSDADTFVMTQFEMVVLPLNDLPSPFTLLKPPNDTLFASYDDTLITFSWSKAISYDGEPVHYLLKFAVAQPESIWGPFDTSFAMIDITRFERNVPLAWSVIAYDDTIGFTQSADTFRIEIDAIVGIDREDQIPVDYSLSNNFPNPFNPLTVIQYAIPITNNVSMVIYNLMGQEVIRWEAQDVSPGFYKYTWYGINQVGIPVSSGMYLYRLVAGDFVQTRKMVLLK